MVNREAFLLWNNISRLVDASLGLSMLADYDAAGVITDQQDKQIASGATSTTAVHLLRHAADLLVELEQHLATAPCTKGAQS